ncbi:LPXTG cell wall anchor domain-containing protein [Companilactobacillus metriopterae]|uniref:LPXTG cell wall anchor domain-containing protein n=1 Tax=Companilactobacillus metriopterae TaxID=1909267 RepID=UPI00100B511D|nr:LPXTG cell wall anchor domain-containing protein [Companilactobacillus metriopterae]
MIISKFKKIIIVLFGLFIILGNIKPTTVSAASYSSSDIISSAEISSNKPSYSYSSSVSLTYEFDASGVELKNGDTLTIDLPEQLKVSKPGTTFDITNELGEVIGNVTLNADNTISVNFTNVEGVDDLKGKIEINDGITPSKNANVGMNDVVFETMNGEQHSDMNIAVSTSNTSKKGVLGQDDEGNPVITWSILVNRNELDLGTINVEDRITDPNLEYILGSASIYEATWKSDGIYNTGRELNSGEYIMQEMTDGVNVTIPDAGAQMYVIKLQTKVVPPELANDGTTVFRNNASMTWNGNGTGEGSVAGEDSSSAKVTSNVNTGNGSGKDRGSATLQKTDADDDSILVPGATYGLFDENDVLIDSKDTDANGKITVEDLKHGNYYFKELNAPDGYEINEDEIHFTINSENTVVNNLMTSDPKSEVPVIPIDPVEPIKPIDPTTPVDPNPVDPPKPIDPVTPVDPNPVDPPKPIDPVTPVDPNPVDPPKPIDPVTPVDPNPVDPPKPIDPVTPIDPNPVDPPKPIDPVTPVDPNPVDPPKPIDPVTPVDPNPVDPISPITPINPIGTDQSNSNGKLPQTSTKKDTLMISTIGTLLLAGVAVLFTRRNKKLTK